MCCVLRLPQRPRGVSVRSASRRPPRRAAGGMLTWSELCVRRACVRVWERACVSLTRGTVMNRGCVFASRDLARCGSLQKCGQAVAAAAAAETASQEPLSPRPQLPGDAAEPPEKVCKLPAGASRTPGHLWAGAGSLRGAEPAAAASPARRPPQPVGASARAGAATLGAHWLSLRASGEAPLASTPPASSRPRPLLAGIATSSPPLPRVTARARAAAGGGGARQAAGDASSAAESPRSRLNFSRSS